VCIGSVKTSTPNSNASHPANLCKIKKHNEKYQWGVCREGSEVANSEMRNAMKNDSEKFNGVSDTNDPSSKKYTNMTGEGSAGIDGDGTRLAGTRTSEKELKKFGEVVKDDATKTWEFTGNNNQVTGQPYTLTEALAAQGGATGGSQALLPTFAGEPVEREGFLDKLQESYAGPHDYLGGRLQGGYDNLQTLGVRPCNLHSNFLM
jgi:filamentous hemagglutinin